MTMDFWRVHEEYEKTGRKKGESTAPYCAGESSVSPMFRTSWMRVAVAGGTPSYEAIDFIFAKRVCSYDAWPGRSSL